MTPSIPFAFYPVPRSSTVALRAGRLTATEHRVLVGVCERMNQSTWTASFRDLDQLAAQLAWEHTLDFLSKILRALRAKGWIEFESKPGRTHHGYVIQLRHEQSEQSPGRDSAEASAVALRREPRSAATGPSRAPIGPSSEQPANAQSEPISDEHRERPVRAARDVSREAKACSEGVVERERSRFALSPVGKQDLSALDANARVDELIESTDRMLEMLDVSESRDVTAGDAAG